MFSSQSTVFSFPSRPSVSIPRVLDRKPTSRSPRRLLNTGTLADSLGATQPSFSLSSKNVHILQQPSEFYSSLLAMIKRARKRIYISSLYIGAEEDEIFDSLVTALATNPSLTVRVHVDYHRSTRPGTVSTADKLVPLLKAFPDRMQIHLFRSPTLRGLTARVIPYRINEGWGTWHAKIYGADNDVIISGANLNSSYFTDRQDRYLSFTEQPKMASYLLGLLDVFSSYSYRLLPYTTNTSDYTLEWPKPEIHPHYMDKQLGRAVGDYQASNINQAWRSREQDPAHDTVIFPICQSGGLGVREEEACVDMLLNSLKPPKDADSPPVVNLTSGYFSLFEPYQNLALKSPADWKIVAASPRANGFYGSPGLSGKLPDGYTVHEQTFWTKVLAAGRPWRGIPGSGIELTEWERPGWTYHAKGIWIQPSRNEPPNVTLFGSTNLNSRSANLDTELSFLMITRSPTLRNRLAGEFEWLQADAKRVDVDEWERQGRGIGSLSWSTRALVAFCREFL